MTRTLMASPGKLAFGDSKREACPKLSEWLLSASAMLTMNQPAPSGTKPASPDRSGASSTFSNTFVLLSVGHGLARELVAKSVSELGEVHVLVGDERAERHGHQAEGGQGGQLDRGRQQGGQE